MTTTRTSLFLPSDYPTTTLQLQLEQLQLPLHFSYKQQLRLQLLQLLHVYNYNITTSTTSTTLQLRLRLQLQLHGTSLHCTTSCSCGRGDRCNHSKNHNHLPVHQWVRRAIHASKQLASPIVSYPWIFRHRLVRYYRYWCLIKIRYRIFQVYVLWLSSSFFGKVS